MQSNLCSQLMHSKAPQLRSRTCNWAPHKSVHLHFALLQGGCGVRKSTNNTFLCREVLLVCSICLFSEELLLEEVSNSLLGCFVPFRRKLISPVKCSPSTDRHMFSGHQPKEHSLQPLAYIPSWQAPGIFGEPTPGVLHLSPLWLFGHQASKMVHARGTSKSCFFLYSLVIYPPTSCD